jgi:hypothetical protein
MRCGRAIRNQVDQRTDQNEPGRDKASMNSNEKPLAGGLWRDNPETPEGKYLIMRRDGTIPEWPNFTLGAKDPCAPAGLLAYAAKARELGLDPAYADSIERLARQWDDYRVTHGTGDPDRGRHREDDPATIALMRLGRSV